MRSVLVLLIIVLFLILSLPLFLIMKLVSRINRRAGVVGSQRIVSFAFRLVLFAAGAKITAKGMENIPDEPVLFVANHRSYADIPLVYITNRNPVGFVAKKEIGKVPGLSWWMTNMNCLFLDRADLKQSLKVILKAIDNVKSGYSMFIMPEGTRNHSDELLPFKEGSFKIAEKAGCKIVPVAISNADALYELQKPVVKKANVVITYGTPIETKDLSREELKGIGAKVRDIIAGMLKEDEVYWKK